MPVTETRATLRCCKAIRVVKILHCGITYYGGGGWTSSEHIDGEVKAMIEAFDVDALPEPPSNGTTLGVVTGTAANPILTIGYNPAAQWPIYTQRAIVDSAPVPEWAWAAPGAGHLPHLTNFRRTDLVVEIEGPGVLIDWEVGRSAVSWGLWPVPGPPYVYYCDQPTPSDPPGGLLPLISYTCENVGSDECDVITRHKLVHSDVTLPLIPLQYFDDIFCHMAHVRVVIPRTAYCPSTP